MSRDSEMFSAALAQAALQAADDEIGAAVLQTMVDKIDTPGGLAAQLAEAGVSEERQAGHFGMEIIGSILIPILIEAGKSIWEAYVKKLTGKAADRLAEVTFSKAQVLAEQLWQSEEQTEAMAAYERRIRELASEKGITQDQITHVIAAIRSEKMHSVLAQLSQRAT